MNPPKGVVRRRRAMTVIEMLVAVILVALLFGFLWRSFRIQRLAFLTVEKLDAIQAVRVAERRVRAEVDLATAVLYPPAEQGGATARHAYLVFTGGDNVPRMIYRDRSGNLCSLGRGGTPDVLCSGVNDLVVRQPLRGNVTCELTLNAEDRTPLVFVISAQVGNGYSSGGQGASS